VLSKVLLLAFRDGLSDERAMQAVRFDLRWKVALDLPIDHPGFHPTSLVRFRARLLLHGKQRLVFERSIELATELGLLEGPAEQIVDSTPMLGAAAVQDTAVLVRTAVGKLIETVHAADPQTAGELRDALRFEYARPRDKPDGDWADRDTRMGLLGDVARDAQRALHAVQGNEALTADEHVAEAARVLGEIIGQEYDVDEDEIPRPRGGRRVRQIVSALDPEMRHGRQTPGRRFTGYKLHAAVAADVPVVTAISVAPANEHDGRHAGALVDQQPEQRRPERVIGDTAYGNSEAREDLAQRSIRVLAPVHSSSPKHGTIPKAARRAAARTDRSPLPRPQKPLPGSPKSDAAGHVDRSFGEPTPDRRCPTRPARLDADNDRPQHHGRPPQGRRTRLAPTATLSAVSYLADTPQTPFVLATADANASLVLAPAPTLGLCALAQRS